MNLIKSLARSKVWWPGLNKDVETIVKQCEVCDAHQPNPPLAEIHPWEWPNKPWHRIHIDHAGEFLGKNFLVVVDAHSKWLECEMVLNTSTAATLCVLRKLFAIHGLPATIVSDNSTAFTSEEFTDFLEMNGIRHIRTTPRHPATNGLARRAVQTIKRATKKKTDNDDIQTVLSV